MGDSGMSWYLHMEKSDKEMKYPLIVSFEERPMVELIQKSIENSRLLLESVTDHSSIMDSDLSSKFGTNFEVGSSSNSHGGSSGSSTVLSTNTNNSPTSENVDSIFVDPIGLEDLKVKYFFENKEKLKTALGLISIKKFFEFVTIKSNQTRLVVRCVVPNCEWYMRASKYGNGDFWMVRKYVKDHTCPIDVALNDHRQATSKLVSDCVTNLLRDDATTCPKKIVAHMLRDYGVHISYFKARMAKEKALEALQGSADESYALLPSYLHALKSSNPGSVVDYQTDDEGRFLYMFMAFGASLEGWKYCRPVISVDGTFLTAKFVGTLFMACAMDANNHIFPIGFGIGDSENDSSWTWFFQRLRGALGSRDNLVIVSDRHMSIENAISTVYPDAEHVLCTYHLLNNLKSALKFKGHDVLFENCSRAYLKIDFEFYMRQMESIKPRIREYLLQVGYEKWARSYSTRRRYTIMTSNISESLNSVWKEARDFPVVALLENLRQKVQNWFDTRRLEAASTFTRLSKWAEDQLVEQNRLGRTMNVYSVGHQIYQVVDGNLEFVVEILKRSCTCRKWDLDEIPCSHACAAIRKANLCHYTYVSDFYMKDVFVSTYNGIIHPVGSQKFWDIPDIVKDHVVLPPIVRRRAGRPKKKRIPSAGEKRRQIKCGRCNENGHNRKRCRNAIHVKMKSMKRLKSCVHPH
ncbi:protein FAR1-RELATED SEQUENCE 5-like [Humulus lupulus]|uniref:protein FAR1-RELATED SEQUENCE 5-like n=1 Tax=Humulus lupulus TaxID=3486 RepID=UPI002B405AA9|nr:protein FAR1-RELATED SEQUENCE 5-like [Humulus lupulus]